MQETLKYIKVLNWGYGGFAPMTLTPDYKESLEQVRERLGLLDSLNYDALLREAISPEGKEYLARYRKTDSTFEYGLRFLRDKEAILNRTKPDWLPEFLEVAEKGEDGKLIYNKIKYPYKYNGLQALKDGADKYKADGVWTDEKRKEYKYQLSRLEKALEDRLRQFAAAYDYPLSADEPEQQPEPQQIAPEPQREKVVQANRVVLPEVLDTKRVKQIFGGAIAKGWMQPNGNNGYKWIGFGNRGQGQQLVYMCGQIFGYHKGISGNDGANIPSKELERLFGISGLYSKLIKCWEAAKPQTWRIPIDKMIEEVTKGT